MAEHPIQGLMGVTIEKIRDMVNSETIIGDPIHVDDTTIIPVSRVTFGFASRLTRRSLRYCPKARPHNSRLTA